MLSHCFEISQVRENEISVRNSSGGLTYFRTLEETLLTDAMQIDIHETFYPFYTTKKMPMLR